MAEYVLLCKLKKFSNLICNMKMTNKLLVAGLLSLALGMTACSSSEDNPTITNADNTVAETSVVTFSLSANTSFTQTSGRSVDETYYSTLSNYTVQLEQDGAALYTWAYSEMPSSVELTNGTYTLIAYCGEDKAASTTTMYVYGETEFSVASADVSVSVSCEPVCARVTVVFDDTMATYFSDYSVDFSTSALGSDTFNWAKDETGPVYLKVDEEETVTAVINMTRIDTAATSSATYTYTLSPLDAMNLYISASENSGSMTLTITIDDETNDQTIDIEIPYDWK